ncbi:MAG: DUF1801 domain-containing protein [Candidatus Eremiobacteraeota bacterium]|nr:DUF1801 domain-containing protein [Candidatus Eremiobacteraeota bacterium]
MTLSPERRLAKALAEYTPEIAAQAKAVLAAMRARLPGAVEMVYDNYNALVVGFGAEERPREAVFSIALYPDHVTLVFIWGAGLFDPDELLRGEGNQVRHIRLDGPESLDAAPVRALMAEAIARSARPFDETQPNRVVIRAVAAKHRPRRPARHR